MYNLFFFPTNSGLQPELKKSGNEKYYTLEMSIDNQLVHIGYIQFYPFSTAYICDAFPECKYADALCHTRAYAIPINHIWRDETIEIEVRASRILNNKA